MLGDARGNVKQTLPSPNKLKKTKTLTLHTRVSLRSVTSTHTCTRSTNQSRGGGSLPTASWQPTSLPPLRCTAHNLARVAHRCLQLIVLFYHIFGIVAASWGNMLSLLGWIKSVRFAGRSHRPACRGRGDEAAPRRGAARTLRSAALRRDGARRSGGPLLRVAAAAVAAAATAATHVLSRGTASRRRRDLRHHGTNAPLGRLKKTKHTQPYILFQTPKARSNNDFTV